MKIRWKLLILLMGIALASLLAATLLHNYMARRLGNHLAANTRDMLIRNARQQLQLLVNDYGRTLERSQDALELALRLQVHDVERRLAGDPPASPKVYFSDDYDKPLARPPDVKPSDRHFSKGAPVDVSYAHQVVYLAEGAVKSDPAVAADIARLSGATEVYRAIQHRIGELTYWQYTSLATGVHVSYPGHGGYPADYEPRTRPWYLAARQAGKLTRTRPIVDAATRTVTLTLAAPVRRPDGSFAGVTAIDVPLTAIFAELSLPADLAGAAEVMLVIPAEKGSGHEGKLEILAQKSYQAQHDWRTAVKVEYVAGDDAKALAGMAARAKGGESCVLQMGRRGRQALWACCAGEGTGKAFPLVIVPYDRITAGAVEAERYVWAKVVQGLQIGGGLMLIAAAAVAGVAFYASRRVTRPIRELVAAAEKLAGGDYDARADIHTGDELQELGEVFNAVGPQLKEREKLKQSLALAMEIQQHLLPAASPELAGFDIAGQCDYCDETGGDYYDFIQLMGVGPDKLGIAVGDVTGHGIGAALLMASARAVLRSHAGRYGGDLSKLLAALNEHLYRDTGDERFMTLFVGILDGASRSLTWASGGHDPALWRRRSDGQFEELPNTGAPLGVLEGMPFDQAGPVTMAPGDIIVVGTDGIWEAANPDHDMFGKDRLRDVIAANADRSAAEIHEAVVAAVHAFRGAEPQKDDITLVVIKAV